MAAVCCCETFWSAEGHLRPWRLSFSPWILTINVPVVYMGRDVWIWMGGNLFLGAFEGIGHEILTFWVKMALATLVPISGPKTVSISGPTPSVQTHRGRLQHLPLIDLFLPVYSRDTLLYTVQSLPKLADRRLGWMQWDDARKMCGPLPILQYSPSKHLCFSLPRMLTQKSVLEFLNNLWRLGTE
jgi:hypothetical protein